MVRHVYCLSTSTYRDVQILHACISDEHYESNSLIFMLSKTREKVKNGTKCNVNIGES